MKIQLSPILFFLLILMEYPLTGQDSTYIDPLQKALMLLHKNDCITYSAEKSMKQLFERDTSKSSAKVSIKKDNTHIYYIDILNDDMKNELLFYQDTVWMLDHQNKTRIKIGNGILPLPHNMLSNFFPQNFFIVDSNRKSPKQNFPVIRRNGRIATVSIPISSLPQGMDSVLYTINIDTSSSMIKSILSIAYFNMGENLYDNLSLSNFEFPSCEKIEVPQAYYTYTETSLTDVPAKQATSHADNLNMLKGLYFSDLDGKAIMLPESGLIFLDLWYVGCFPCIKSAPYIEELYNQYKEKVHFYSINEIDDDIIKIKRFQSKMGISFPILLPAEKKYFAKKLNSNAYPKFILIQAESGKILWWTEGFREDLSETIRHEFDTRL